MMWMVPSSMDRDVRSDMSCRGCDMDNLDRVVGNASVDYRDEISVGNDGVGVDDGSWSLPISISLHQNQIMKQKAGQKRNFSGVSATEGGPTLISLLRISSFIF